MNVLMDISEQDVNRADQDIMVDQNNKVKSNFTTKTGAELIISGDYCKPCQCSGNIDPDDMGSCDTVTGECLRCLNNTYGTACALCAPGYFGDAVNLKDCQGNFLF